MGALDERQPIAQTSDPSGRRGSPGDYLRSALAGVEEVKARR